MVVVRERASRSLEAKLAFVKSEIESHGLTVHLQSRLAREAAVFIVAPGVARTVEPTDPSFDDAREALRDYTLFEFILEAWPFDGKRTDATDRLRLALKDAVDPWAAAKHTPGRDTQLELYVAAALCRAGLSVELDTPDVRTFLNGQYFYVEAKRPKSEQAIEDAVRTAAGQIERTGCPGAAFLDVSLAFNPTGGFVTRVMPDDEFQRLYHAGLHAAVGRVAEPVKKMIAGTRISTVCFQDHQLRQAREGWKLESCCVTLANPNASPGLARFGAAFERSLDAAWQR